MSELRDQGTDLPRETGSVVRNGSGAGDVPVHAGDNPTMSLSELYERRDQREAAAGAGTSDEDAAADEGVRETEASAGVTDESSDAGYPAYEVGYPANAGTSHEGFDGHATNEVIDGQVVSDPVPDWEAGNWDQQPEPVGDAGPLPGDGGRGAGDERFSGWPDTEPAVAAADAAGDQEEAAGGRETDGSPGFFGRVGELQDQGAVESGERDGGGRTGPGTRTSADTSQQGERGEETGGEKDAEGQGEDGREEKPRDLAPVQDPAPDAETDRPTEASAEAAPDQQPDDPRMAAMERQMERMMATVEAMQEKQDAAGQEITSLRADHDASEARNQVLTDRIDELEAQHDRDQARIEELTAKVEASDGDRQAAHEREQSGDKQPTRPNEPDAPNADVAEILGQTGDKQATDDRVAPEIPDRQWFTVKNASAVTSVVSFGSSIAAIFSHIPPEIAVGPAAVGAVSGVLGSTIAENIRKKRKG